MLDRVAKSIRPMSVASDAALNDVHMFDAGAPDPSGAVLLSPAIPSRKYPVL